MTYSRLLTCVGTVALTLMISACVYPDSNVQQGGEATALYFSNPPAEARVFIDGLDAGSASAFNGTDAVLAVTPGRHDVRIKLGSRTIFEKDIYVGDGVVLNIDTSVTGAR